MKLLILLRDNCRKNSKHIGAFFIAAVLVFLPTAAFAQTTGLGLNIPTFGLPTTDVRTMGATLIKNALGLLGVFLVIQLIYGGFLYMTHGGSDEAKKKAVGTLTSSVIGFFIIMMAPSIATFVIDAITKAS